MKNIIILILISILAFFVFKSNILENKISMLNIQKGQLEKELKSKIEIKNNKLKYTFKEGKDVKKIEKRIPKESEIKVVEVEEKLSLNLWDKLTTDIVPTTSTGTYILIKHTGFTFYPAISALYDFNDINVGIESRLFYFRDLGFGAGICPKYPYIFLDYRLSFIYLDNLTLGMFINNKSNLGIKLGIGLR